MSGRVRRAGRSRLPGLVMAIVASVFASDVQAEQLSDLLVQAYRTNPQVLAERAKLRQSDEKVVQANANWKPTVEFSAVDGHTRDEVSGGTPLQNQAFRTPLASSSQQLTISQWLFRGGRTVDQYRQAVYGVRAQLAHLHDIEAATFLQVITDYEDLLLAQSTVALADVNVTALQQTSQSVRARTAGGELSRTDVAQAEAALAQTLAQRDQARAKLQVARLALQRDAGVTVAEVAPPDVDLRVPTTESEIDNVALQNNEAVISAEMALRSADFNFRQIRDQRVPTLALQVQLAQQSGASFPSEKENLLSVLVQLRAPLYSGGSRASQEREARDQRDEARHGLEQAQRQATYTAQSGWTNWKQSDDAAARVAEQVAADEIALKGVSMQQRAGERTVLDVLNATQALFQARTNQVQAQHDAYVAKAQLLSALGLLSSDALRLGLDDLDKDKYRPR